MVFGAVAVIKKNTMHFGSVGMPFSLPTLSTLSTAKPMSDNVNEIASTSSGKAAKSRIHE
jgi:hypothetical protein